MNNFNNFCCAESWEISHQIIRN